MSPEITPQPTPAAPEQMPVGYGQGVEYAPAQPTPERAPERAAEYEQNMKAVDRASAAPAAPPVLPMPAQPQVVPMPAPVAPVTDDTPAIAGDDDLIEKEWVDKAKKIVAESRNEPYKLAQEVSKLQADYLYKRYGKEIGVST